MQLQSATATSRHTDNHPPPLSLASPHSPCLPHRRRRSLLRPCPSRTALPSHLRPAAAATTDATPVGRRHKCAPFRHLAFLCHTRRARHLACGSPVRILVFDGHLAVFRIIDPTFVCFLIFSLS